MHMVHYTITMLHSSTGPGSRRGSKGVFQNPEKLHTLQFNELVNFSESTFFRFEFDIRYRPN